MKVAFDCSGTLINNRNREKVVKLYKWFESKGAEMYIWSNMYSYTGQAIEECMIAGICVDKYSKLEAKEEDRPVMDVAVDDDSFGSQYLAANKIVLVSEIPDNEELFEEVFGHLCLESIG